MPPAGVAESQPHAASLHDDGDTAALFASGLHAVGGCCFWLEDLGCSFNSLWAAMLSCRFRCFFRHGDDVS